MNGKAKLIMWIAGVALTLLTLGGSYWSGMVQSNRKMIEDHRIERIHSGAASIEAQIDITERVRANEIRFEQILRELQSIDRRLESLENK